MKKLLTLLLSLSLLVACKNDKTKSSSETEKTSKDDYRNEDTDGDKDKKEEDNGGVDRNSGNFDDVVDDDEEGNHVADGAKWSSRDITGFKTQCEKKAIKNGATTTEAQTYCNCMLRKLSTKYPDINDINMEGADIKIMATQCEETAIKTSSSSSQGWTRKQELDFVNSCVREAKKAGMKDELDAQSYCDCMQYKIEKLYPSYAEANRLTEADLKKPSMQKMIDDCLPEH